MNENDQFFKQAGKIHDIHIRQEQSADMQIAEKRINQYFKGVLQLTWKSIIYEINKLPELERNKYFIRLVEEQTSITRKKILNTIKNMSILKFIKLRKELKNVK